jgi:toprim domain protein
LNDEAAGAFLIIVEGKNDRRRLRQLVPESVPIAITYGIPSQSRLEALRKEARHRQVVIFTDADATGRRIRGILREWFPDAVNLYTKPGYRGVEHTPLDYLEGRLRAAGVLADDGNPAPLVPAAASTGKGPRQQIRRRRG